MGSLPAALLYLELAQSAPASPSTTHIRRAKTCTTAQHPALTGCKLSHSLIRSIASSAHRTAPTTTCNLIRCSQPTAPRSFPTMPDRTSDVQQTRPTLPLSPNKEPTPIQHIPTGGNLSSLYSHPPGIDPSSNAMVCRAFLSTGGGKYRIVLKLYVSIPNVSIYGLNL
jgi:hypothetical protein